MRNAFCQEPQAGQMRARCQTWRKRTGFVRVTAGDRYIGQDTRERRRKHRQLARGMTNTAVATHQINEQQEDLILSSGGPSPLIRSPLGLPRSLVTVEMLVWLYAFIVGRIAEIAAWRTDIACFLRIRT